MTSKCNPLSKLQYCNILNNQVFFIIISATSIFNISKLVIIITIL